MQNNLLLPGGILKTPPLGSIVCVQGAKSLAAAESGHWYSFRNIRVDITAQGARFLHIVDNSRIMQIDRNSESVQRIETLFRQRLKDHAAQPQQTQQQQQRHQQQPNPGSAMRSPNSVQIANLAVVQRADRASAAADVSSAAHFVTVNAHDAQFITPIKCIIASLLPPPAQSADGADFMPAACAKFRVIARLRAIFPARIEECTIVRCAACRMLSPYGSHMLSAAPSLALISLLIACLVQVSTKRRPLWALWRATQVYCSARPATPLLPLTFAVPPLSVCAAAWSTSTCFNFWPRIHRAFSPCSCMAKKQ
jgi:hypothetical protein